MAVVSLGAPRSETQWPSTTVGLPRYDFVEHGGHVRQQPSERSSEKGLLIVFSKRGTQWKWNQRPYMIMIRLQPLCSYFPLLNVEQKGVCCGFILGIRLHAQTEREV